MKMSVSIDLLNALKANQGGCSDYRLAKLLCVGQPTIVKYNREELPLSAEKVILACEIAGFDPIEWLLKLHEERAKSDAEKALWRDVMHRLAA
ncbi:MAG TPA: DUF3693 domain-containing protein [Azonexus sp.]|nr:DUF3693 domain-containing protein [Azonexus sp.]